MRTILNKTMDELVSMQESLVSDPRNRDSEGSLYLYNPATRKKLAAIASQISFLMAEKRAAEGRPVPVWGYSGRRSKK